MDDEKQQESERFAQYLHEIQAIPPSTQEEEAQLTQLMARGKAEQTQTAPDAHIIEESERAQQRLIEAHLLLVATIAQRYKDHGVPLMDLVDAGNGGLRRATEGFDSTKGYRFSTYATWWIRQAMTRIVAS